MDDKIPIYTDLIITPKSGQSLSRYFNSIKRNLPKGWYIDRSPYLDNDTFLILKDVYKIRTHKFVDKIINKSLAGIITLGLTQDAIIILKINLTIDIPKEETMEIIGYVLHSYHEYILKPNRHYNLFSHVFSFGGPTDENWYKKDLRDERSIKLFSKADEATFFLGRSSSVELIDKKISYSAPNNIALSLSLMKKSLKKAKTLYSKLISKKQDKKIRLEDEYKGELYDYFEEIQTSIIFSYISVEAFSNAAIPEEYIHEKVNEKGIKEMWNKENIERWMSTSEKVGDILPIVLKSDNIKSQLFWSTFKELEKLRNSIVHQKTIESGTKLDSEIFNYMLNPLVFEKIESSLKIIGFFYKLNSAHPYFPLGFGIAKFQVHEIESMEKHFRKLRADE